MNPIRYIGTLTAAAAVALTTIGSAQAAGCIKGAAVGGVAGGCLVGRHMAKKHEQEQAAQRKAAAAASQTAQ
ncbi:TPA: hypothetical protein QDB09_004707 [Burkholderia vietnamiensis]|nr:hypothetical protein [Burkholderia vietnamiensis]